MLLEPWLNRLDEGQPGQIAALSFAAFDQAEQHDWNWPLRVGIPAPPSLSEQLTAIRGVRRELIELVQQPMSATDVVLLDTATRPPRRRTPGSLPDWPSFIQIRIRSSARSIRSPGKISAPTAVIDMSARIPCRNLRTNSPNGTCHVNKPLDVALFDAYRTTFNPKGDRGAEAFLRWISLAPRSNQWNTFDGIKIENRVKDLVDRLHGLPGYMVIGPPPRNSEKLGI